MGPSDFTEIHHRGYISVPSGFLTRSEIRKSQSFFVPNMIFIVRVFYSRAGHSLQAQGTNVAVLPKASLPPQTQEPKLQLCPKAGLPLVFWMAAVFWPCKGSIIISLLIGGWNSRTKVAVLPKASLPPQIQEQRLQFYRGWIGAVASRCFPNPTLSLASKQTLKDEKRSQGY